ncbi:hypothetical protein [Natrinema versiforme]|uniref:Uncharacterized protein n=1 Tax=Natrinema versiforme TaxID=88724 RepID=A0A4P8WKC6_9EURY|nr:hypothetical protein [Natrinema versiforme]QCS43542.1 hypothetical protein FEJ81_14735 [Natrinema versiforme]
MGPKKPSFEHESIISDSKETDGKFSCPICHEFSADSVRSVKGHISGSRDETHAGLGWNHEAEIRATADE